MTGGVPAPRQATLRTLRNPGGTLIDRGVVLFWPGPGSFTGEDVGELQVHGGAAVVRALLRSLGSLRGFRLAEPGEFTRRALENGRLDLTEAEGLADLISAETEGQRSQALARSEGRAREICESWRDRLLRARALFEAEIDFGEEESLGESSAPAWRLIAEVRAEIAGELSTRRGEIVREGAEIVILGRPNAGKSSLLNALARREVAIVSPEAGTTRDQIEVRLDLDGYPVTLVDTAGLRRASGVEAEGVRRARRRAENADIVVLLQDGTASKGTSLRPAGSGPAPVVSVGTKADLIDSDKERVKSRRGFGHLVSSVTGEGLDGLLADLTDRVSGLASGGEASVVTRERHRNILGECLEALEESERAKGGPPEIAAELLRTASHAIGRITGRVGVEDVLDVVFSEFCIGK